MALLSVFALFLSACLCSGEFMPYYTEVVQRAAESGDVAEMSALYHPDASYQLNDQPPVLGNASISEALRQWHDKIAVQRRVMTSPIYEEHGTVHFTQQIIIESKQGCVAVVHSLESWQFDATGKLVSQRSTWEESVNAILADMACKHGESHNTHLVEESKGFAEKAFANHHVFEQADLEEFLKLWAPNGELVLSGSAPAVGLDAIKEAMEPVFKVVTSMVFTPSSHIFVQGNTAAAVTTLFVITNHGCVHTSSVVTYSTFNDAKQLVRAEYHFQGHSFAEFVTEITKDCSSLDSLDAVAYADATAGKPPAGHAEEL